MQRLKNVVMQEKVYINLTPYLRGCVTVSVPINLFPGNSNHVAFFTSPSYILQFEVVLFYNP